MTALIRATVGVGRFCGPECAKRYAVDRMGARVMKCLCDGVRTRASVRQPVRLVHAGATLRACVLVPLTHHDGDADGDTTAPLQLPHVNVLSKCDQLPSRGLLDEYLDADAEARQLRRLGRLRR